MGCSTSKPVIDTTDDVLRNCKVRRLHIKEAIKYRKDFAIAHTAYIHSLKDVGSALKHFARREYVYADVSPVPSSTAVLALPPPLSPSLEDLSSPHQSGVHAPTLSPPNSLGRKNVDAPSILAPKISISPPLSPMRLPTSDSHSSLLPSINNQVASAHNGPSESPQSRSPLVDSKTPPLRTHSLDGRLTPQRTHSLNNMVSPDRGSEFSPPYYSPSRDDLDEALVAYSPPPPPSLLTDTTWFNFDIFTPPPFPQHLQEKRRMNQESDLKQEGLSEASKVEEVEEEIPELEEADRKEDEGRHDDRDPKLGQGKDVVLDYTIPEEVEKIVVLDETVDSPASEVIEDEPVAGNLEEDISTVPSVRKETVASETLVRSVTQKEQGPPVVLKERNVTEAMQYIEDLFVRAYQCGWDVSRMLETQMHHQPKPNGMKDSIKVFNAVTSHWSRKTPALVMGDDDDSDGLLECGMSGSHVSTLERLYAWERKLHHEVKEGRLLRIAFDQKFKELHNLNAKDGNQVERDKLKATIKKLDTRLVVAIRAISAASVRIQLLTNEELYPQLCEMLGGLTSMWRMMAECHRMQTTIALELQTFEDLVAEIEATEAHKKATTKLKHLLEKLQTHIQNWLWSQKKYIVELDEWIKRCYEIKDPSKEPLKGGKRASSDGTEKAPIFQLLRAWRSSIMGLGLDSHVNGIKSFTAAMRALEEDQFNELKSKRQSERSTKRLGQQTGHLDRLEREKTENKRANLTFSPSRLLRLPSARRIPEKRARLDKYKSQVETERHDYFTAAQARKNATIDLLQQQLPALFQSLSAFAENAQKMYEKVKEMAEEDDTADKQISAARLMWEEH